MKYANTTETMENVNNEEMEDEVVVRTTQRNTGIRNYANVFSSKGKVKKLCENVKTRLNDACEEAPEFLTELPDDEEIELTGEQVVGLGFMHMTFDSRRRALKRAELDPTVEFNKAKQIDDLENVIKDSVKLLAKGKYATKTETRNMIARITAPESGIGYEQHEPGIDEAVQRMVTNITNGTTNERAFTFEEALNHAMENASFNI